MYYKKVNVDETKLMPGMVMLSVEVQEMKKNGILRGYLNKFSEDRDIVNHYFGRVEKVAKDVKRVKVGDMVVFSQFGGRNVFTTGKKMIKIIEEDNILLYKYSEKFDIKVKGFKIIGQNVLVEYIVANEEITDSGLILPRGLGGPEDQDPRVHDLIKAKVIAVGERVINIKKGDIVFIIDGFQNMIHEMLHSKTVVATVMEYNIVFMLNEKTRDTK